MMKFVVVVVAIVGFLFSGLNFHIIHMDSGFKILKKVELGFEDTYVDARGLQNQLKLITKPRLIEAGIKDFLEE